MNFKFILKEIIKNTVSIKIYMKLLFKQKELLVFNLYVLISLLGIQQSLFQLLQRKFLIA